MTISAKPPRSTVFVRRLGPHHFAHLRAIAEGLDLQDSAKRYLGIEHGHEAKTAHHQTVDAVRALARRRHESAWRLIGITIRIKSGSDRPTIDDFCQERALDGWSQAEIMQMYHEAYPADRQDSRRYNLRERQLKLLRHIEGLAAEQPRAADLVSGWFDDVTANKLIAAGMISLGDLNSKISVGGRWFSALPAIGKAKAQRIASHLAMLIPRQVQSIKPVFALSATPSLFACTAPFTAPSNAGTNALIVPGVARSAAAPSTSLLQASNDLEAVQAWIKARAGSLATAKAYQREASRLLLWLQYECAGATLSQMSVNLCGDYMAFLQNIPAKWISRESAKPGMPGWAPFRGPLSHTSHRQAIVIIASLFTWLQAAQYLQANPWRLVNQKTGDDRSEKMLDTKALSESAALEIMRFIDAQAPSPSRSRIRFILKFVEAVGLRSAELLSAKLGDLRREPEGWVMQIHGKGAKNRLAAVPGQAFLALQEYLDVRGLGGIETAPPNAPLLASAKDPMEPVGYQAMYEHVKSWLSKAVSASALPSNERMKLAGASTHWLRHTFGTRAIAREVPLDVIQAQMGHASIQTTTSIYGRAPIKRRVDELGKAFG
jgi:site-specific recombinase XerD